MIILNGFTTRVLTFKGQSPPEKYHAIVVLSWFSNIISLITPHSCLEIQSNSFLIILIQMLALSLKGHLAVWKPSGMPFPLVRSHCLGELIAYYIKQRATLWSRIKQLKSDDHNDLQFRECIIVNVLQINLYLTLHCDYLKASYYIYLILQINAVLC